MKQNRAREGGAFLRRPGASLHLSSIFPLLLGVGMHKIGADMYTKPRKESFTWPTDLHIDSYDRMDRGNRVKRQPIA